jgi:hypothetical protein
MVFKEFMEYMSQLLAKAYLHIIHFIVCWGINVQNNEITTATSWYSITSKFNPLNC